MKARYLSLSPFLIWPQLPRPTPWVAEFGREAMLEVEIGFGNGEFLVRRAQAYPERNFIGLELEWASVQRALRKIAQTQLTNVRVLQINARVALERLFQPHSIQRAYTLFPCPWPKERHAKHRLFSHQFLKLLNSRLSLQSEVQIVTDDEDYMTWVMEQVPNTGFEMKLTPVPARFSTKYERKWQDQGQQQFYHLHLAKQHNETIPLIEDLLLQTYRVTHFDPAQFKPRNSFGAVTVKFKDFLYDPERQRGMVRTFTVEDGLPQDFWIEITRHLDNRWQIRTARGCTVVPTLSVQRSLDLVHETIQQQPQPR